MAAKLPTALARVRSRFSQIRSIKSLVAATLPMSTPRGVRGDPMQARAGRIVDPQHQPRPSALNNVTLTPSAWPKPLQADNHAPRGLAVAEQQPGRGRQRDNVAAHFSGEFRFRARGLHDVHRAAHPARERPSLLDLDPIEPDHVEHIVWHDLFRTNRFLPIGSRPEGKLVRDHALAAGSDVRLDHLGGIDDAVELGLA